MKRFCAAALTGFLLVTGARAAQPDACDPVVGSNNPDAMIAALVPKSQAQIEACAARGIRYASPAAAGAPAKAAPPEANGYAALSLPILFATGSAEISPDTRPIVDGLGKALASAALEPYRFRIEGHTDTTGSAAHNRDLSRRRAMAVTNYLVVQLKIDPARLETAGFGFDRPAVATPPGTAEPRNRRVQIVNIGRP
jgi:outer membrane protein OmpA-like peptidoglycan-associated protein